VRFGFSFARDSDGCSLAASPHSRGPGCAAPGRGGGRWLFVALDTRVLTLALAIASILSALLVPVLPLPTTVILGQSLGDSPGRAECALPKKGVPTGPFGRIGLRRDVAAVCRLPRDAAPGAAFGPDSPLAGIEGRRPC